MAAMESRLVKGEALACCKVGMAGISAFSNFRPVLITVIRSLMCIVRPDPVFRAMESRLVKGEALAGCKVGMAGISAFSNFHLVLITVIRSLMCIVRPDPVFRSTHGAEINADG